MATNALDVEPEQLQNKQQGLTLAEDVQRDIPHSNDAVDEDENAAKSCTGRELYEQPGELSVAQQSYGVVLSPEFVMLRAEYARQRELKAIITAVRCFVALGTASLLYLFITKVTADSAFFIHHSRRLMTINVGVASFDLAILSITIFAFLFKITRAQAMHLKWSSRRHRVVTLLFTECSLQWVNSVAYLVPNVYLLVADCGWSSRVIPAMGSIRWVCWSTVWMVSLVYAHCHMPLQCQPVSHRMSGQILYRLLDLLIIRRGWEKQLEQRNVPLATGTVLDLPFWVHAPKLVLWAPAVTFSVLTSASPDHLMEADSLPPDSAGLVQLPGCAGTIACGINTRDVVFSSIVMGLFISFSLLLVLLLFEAKLQLGRKPYIPFRMANISVRMLMRSRGTVFLFIALTVSLLWFFDIYSCNTLLIGWFGFLPMQLVCSAFVCLSAWVYMPINHRAGLQNQVQLQEAVWTEDRKEEMVSQYCLPGETLFCFETMLKMFYWSYLVYGYKQIEDSLYTAEFAQELYGMDNFDLLWDREKDTKAIIGWGNNTIVIAFRGTASKENVITDAQFWQTPHPPVRGSSWWGTRPKVHGGFLTAWMANGYNAMVMSTIKRILVELRATQPDSCPRVYVTGHSLGGALANLAAIDIARELKDVGIGKLVCYTFGCPRVGNRAFAVECNALVTDMWHVINDQDIVTRAGKLWGVYKRTARRTIIAPGGTMVIRPSFVEVNAYKSILSPGSVSQHLLSNYMEIIREVMCTAFLQSTSQSSGRAGIQHMLQDATMQSYVQSIVRMNTPLMLASVPDEQISRKVLMLPNNESSTEDERERQWCW